MRFKRPGPAEGWFAAVSGAAPLLSLSLLLAARPPQLLLLWAYAGCTFGGGPRGPQGR